MGAQGKIDWDSVEAWKKLVSAIIATGVKLDIRETAKYYGTTYDTLENRLRKVKKDAVVLKEEVGSGEGSQAAPRTSTATTPKKSKTPKKAGGVLDNVANSRVAKPSPSKKIPTKSNSIKQEMLESSMPDIFNDAPIAFEMQGMGFCTDSFNSQNILSQDADATPSFDDFKLEMMNIGGRH